MLRIGRSPKCDFYIWENTFQIFQLFYKCIITQLYTIKHKNMHFTCLILNFKNFEKIFGHENFEKSIRLLRLFEIQGIIRLNSERNFKKSYIGRIRKNPRIHHGYHFRDFPPKMRLENLKFLNFSEFRPGIIYIL